MNNLVLIRLNREYLSYFPKITSHFPSLNITIFPRFFVAFLYIFRPFRLKMPLNIPKNDTTTILKTKLRTDDGGLIIPN